MQGRAHVGAYLKDSRIAAVIIVVVMQEMDGHCLIPRSHDRYVQFRDHSVCNLVPPASLQHDLRVDRASVSHPFITFLTLLIQHSPSSSKARILCRSEM